MSAGEIVDADNKQKNTELGYEVEEIYGDLAQRHDHSRKVDFLEDVPVNQESLGDLVYAVEEKAPSNETSHKEHQRRQAAGRNPDYQPKHNGKDERCENGLHEKPERTQHSLLIRRKKVSFGQEKEEIAIIPKIRWIA